MSYTVVIPARFASSRLPGKPLADIAGKPMVIRVLEQAQKSKASRVIVATDNKDIVDVVKSYGVEVVMTREDHQSGTERLAEVIDKLSIAKNEIIVNVQGDEPMIPPSIIDQVAQNLQNAKNCGMATLAVKIEDSEDIFNPNVVKVVRDKNEFACYFSRAPIPWDRNHFSEPQCPVTDNYFRHIGIYAYRAYFIHQYIAWQPTILEKIEMLEQLRVLWNGEKIHVGIAIEAPEIGVDTMEDLEKIRRRFLV